MSQIDKTKSSFEERCREVFESLYKEIIITDLSHQKTIHQELKQVRKTFLQAEALEMRSIFDRQVYGVKDLSGLSALLQSQDLNLLTRVLLQHFKYLGELSLGMRQRILMLIYERYPLLAIPSRAYSLETILENAKLERDVLKKKMLETIQDATARMFQTYESRVSQSKKLVYMHEAYRGMIPLAEAIRQSRKELYDANEDASDDLKSFFQGNGKPIARAGIGSSVNFENRLKHLMLERVNKGDVFLDIGCGVGAQSYALLQRGAKVVMNEMDARSLFKFMEIMEDMKNTTEAPFDYGLASLSYGAFLDVSRQYQDQSFDGIVCNHVLHYMTPSEIRDMFQEMHRLVKPGGHIYISTLTPYHSSFKYVTYDLLKKQRNHRGWPGEIKNTDEAWFRSTGIDLAYNPMRIFPPYMHPQYPKILSREAKKAAFEVVESGYFGFPTDNMLIESDSRGALFKKLLTEGELGDTVFSIYRKDKSIAYLVATRK